MFSPYAKTPLSAAKKKAKSVFSPLPRTPGSQNCSFGRSFITSIIGETSSHIMECYGSPLPVLVTEALLTLSEKISEISVKLEPFGYASLVCGRRLLIWQYKLDSEEKTNMQCRELSLPPSDLAHKADLVHLFLTEESKLPSALAVSPEGHVRYWLNINHDGSSVDATTDLQGQECYSLTSVFPLGCILATTTSSLVIITPTLRDGQPSVICRTLTLPLGVLAGIGRKVSSFIFGVVPAQTSESKQLNRVLSLKDGEDGYILYVLSSSTLQKWYISQKDKIENSDQLIFETDLDRQLKQLYADKVFKKDSCLLSGLKTWCLDIQLCGSGVMILTAGTLQSKTNENIHYAFGILDTSSDLAAQSVSDFYTTDYYEKYEEVHEEKLLNYKFILPTPSSTSAFIYNSEKILCVQIGPALELSEMDFKNSGNFILGSGTCDGLPLFFTVLHGVVCCVPSQKSLASSRIISSMKETSFQQSLAFESTENLSTTLRNAMCAYCNGDLEKCEKLISEILPRSLSNVNCELDEAVTVLSLGIIDDYPVSDPRWCESVPTGSVSSSLIISYQLEDKLKAHDYLISFLKEFDLFDKLSTSKIGDAAIPTNVLLCEHAEKLVAAKAIRLFLTDHNDLIESAVRDSLENRKIEVKNHLTPQDVFFREVSAFHTIFSSLIGLEVDEIDSDETVSKILNVVMTVNKIFVGLLDAIKDYREKKSEVYGLKKHLKGIFSPWTAREGSTGIRTELKKQLCMNLEHTLKITDNIQIQGVVYQQYVDILDFYLESYRAQEESLGKDERSGIPYEFTCAREEFIKPLVNVQQYERAAAIAEKYCDFHILIQICEETANADRLQRYMHQFADKKFPGILFKWYFDKGKRGRIFDRDLGQKEELADFLQAHEGLKWLYYIQEDDYESAYNVLKELAIKETQYLSKKKTLLSLAKLACYVCKDIERNVKVQYVDAVNQEQDLIAHQEALPVSTVEAFGLDPNNMRVFTPEELIEMYITDENPSSNAYDFKIALDLLGFMKKPLSDPDVNNLRIHIWSKALLKDNWDELDLNTPLDAIKETIFFQIIELAYDQGNEIHDFIPNLDDLLQSPDLSNLVDNTSFKFLIQAGYEYILKMID